MINHDLDNPSNCMRCYKIRLSVGVVAVESRMAETVSQGVEMLRLAA